MTDTTEIRDQVRERYAAAAQSVDASCCETDCCSPTAEAFEEGGYEVRTARSSFLAPGAGEALVSTSLRLLDTLAQIEEQHED